MQIYIDYITGRQYLFDIQAGDVSGTGTANQIAYFTGTKTISSLSTTIYPSLTELSYVKGVTSAIQTQINGKLSSISIGSINSQVKSANGLVVVGSSIVTQTADATSVGMVSTGAQTFAGVKTFNDIVNFSNVNNYTALQSNVNNPQIYAYSPSSQFGSIVIQARSTGNNAGVIIATGATATQRAFFGNTGQVLFGASSSLGSAYGLSISNSNQTSGAAGTSIYGTVISQTITAGANNQIMYGLFHKPTFSNGGFTGTQSIVSTIQTSASNNILNATDAGAITLGYSTASIGFYGVTAIVRPTTAIASAAYVAGGGAGSIIKTDDTIGGYTMGQVVQALKNLGLLT